MSEPAKMWFPEDLENALTILAKQFSIDIPEYIIKCVRDDLMASQEGDSVLNAMLREGMGEAFALLEEAQ